MGKFNVNSRNPPQLPQPFTALPSKAPWRQLPRNSSARLPTHLSLFKQVINKLLRASQQ
jgi:hypothetical protein